MRKAVTGPLTGTKLNPLPSLLTTWKRWKARHPDTLVLSTDTGYARDYSRDPYRNYRRSPLSFFGLGKKSPYLPEKELVLGVETEGAVKAYPFSALRKLKSPLADTIAGTTVKIYFHRPSEEAYAEDGKGKRLRGFVSYWFVWYSFHPDTLVYGIKTRP